MTVTKPGNNDNGEVSYVYLQINKSKAILFVCSLISWYLLLLLICIYYYNYFCIIVIDTIINLMICLICTFIQFYLRAFLSFPGRGGVGKFKKGEASPR